MPAVHGYLCTDCGRSHAPKDRQRAIRPMAHMTPAEIVETWQCFYDDGAGNDGAGYRMVCRDLRTVRAQLRRPPRRASSASRMAAA